MDGGNWIEREIERKKRKHGARSKVSGGNDIRRDRDKERKGKEKDGQIAKRDKTRVKRTGKNTRVGKEKKKKK